MKRKVLLLIIAACLLGQVASAQMYTGLEGLLHTPSAEMGTSESIRVGGHYLNRHFIPKGYSDMDAPVFYVAVTPYEWVEASYMVTFWKESQSSYAPDRAFFLKVRPLKEGKWWPALVVGVQDPIGSAKGFYLTEDAPGFYSNLFLAATKHFHFLAGEWGFHLACRYYPNKGNSSWSGIVGGMTWRPDFYSPLRVTAEYYGSGVNLGIDAGLFGFLHLQLILQDFKYLSGGICVEIK